MNLNKYPGSVNNKALASKIKGSIVLSALICLESERHSVIEHFHRLD
jgi:hypothetical protein